MVEYAKLLSESREQALDRMKDKAAALGIDARTLATTVQSMIGGLDVATFKEGGKRYDIRMRLEEESRTLIEERAGYSE